jgi:hypothetical protein
LGAFRGYLTMPVGATYNSNIYATDGKEDSDIVVTARPTMELRSQWSTHEVRLFADGDLYNYQQFAKENRKDGEVGASGRLDIQHDFQVAARVADRWLTEARTDSSAPPDTLKPVKYAEQTADLNAVKTFNRLRISGDANYTKDDYIDAINKFDGSNVDQDNRDHEYTSVQGRADYAISPSTAIFFSATDSQFVYKVKPWQDPKNVPISRDSTGMRYLVGANFDITNLIRGEVSVGSLTENFRAPTIKNLQGFAATAKVDWFPTPLATVEFGAQREVTDTGIVGAAGALSTTLSARVDYEVKRNIILTAQVTRREDEYQGLNRDDQSLAAALDVMYLMNEHLGVALTVQHNQRDTSGSGCPTNESTCAFPVQGVPFGQEIVGANVLLRY